MYGGSKVKTIVIFNGEDDSNNLAGPSDMMDPLGAKFRLVLSFQSLLFQ